MILERHHATQPNLVVRGWRGALAALRRQPAEAWVVAGVVTALYTIFSVTQWNRFDTPSWDLGIFTQLAKAYAGFDAPIVPIKGHGFNLLGDHFHPLLVILGPVYALFPSGLTLLVFQNLLVGWSVLILTRLAVHHVGRVPGLFLGAAYGLSWGIQAAVAVQFHEVALALPLLALALEAYIEGRLRTAVVAGALLVFVKEDMGLTVFAFGLVLAWRFRRRYQAGLGLAVWGLAWVVLSVKVILPALNTGGTYDYSDRIDVDALLANPVGTVITMMTVVEKYETLWLLCLAGGFLFLLSPLAAVLLPTLIWRFAAGNESYWGPDWHYNAVLMPILFAALIHAILRARESRRGWLRSYSAAVVPVVSVVALMLLPGQPLAALAKPETFQQSPRWDAAHRMMDEIPSGAAVESGVLLMPYLVPETEVYWIGNENPAPDYLVVDAEDWSWGPTRPASAEQHAEETYPGENYTLVFDEAGYQLVKRET
ncbi:DUF2079 domain-containing protein [Arthrobacter sp. EH-1B-1]|uniref:DUF2079 domain-containing protein n=1 Tax=Arthrobacter vasquezii TaxID=2977629 RepID=A0ABT6CT26_9MICC|nr:DUF2079 domain-containing protein [Arthrobacter vasquezii]MDF9277203.1 DUF2079 domain-containing protein [Arthrobacter vasquezii]